MPAFHRMPITYVVLILFGTAGFVGSRLASRTKDAASAPPEVASSVEPASEERPSAAAPKRTPAPSDPILRTPDGLRRKIVLTELGVVPTAKPDAPAGSGKAVDYLAIRYVYDETATSFRIGDDRSVEGWVPKSTVLEWNTRLMAKPAPRAGRPLLVVYQEEICLVSALNSSRCPRHKDHCPTVGEETEGADAVDAVLGWPMLASKRHRLDDGTGLELYEVAPLVNAKAAPPSAPPADLKPALRTVYIAFVVDTTASMQSTIDSVRDVAARLTREAGRQYVDVTLRLGLVAYRDKSPAFGYVARRVTKFTDPAGFLKALASLEAAKKGDGSVDESVLEGVALALPGDPEHLDWPTGRDGALASKLLVLLGDAPDHDRDETRARELAALANREAITIATVSLRTPTTLSRDEKARYEAQWRALAAGSHLPPDSRRKFERPIAPQILSLEQVSALSGTLVALIDARVEAARSLAALAAAEAEGRLTDYVNSQGLAARNVSPVLTDIRRADPDARTNLQFDGRRAPTVRRGWIAQRIGKSELVTLQMLMGRDELADLITELSSLQQAARASAAELEKLVEIGTAAASGETSFLRVDEGDQTFADHLKRRRGVAPARADSLLLRSRTDLIRADDLDRAELDRRLGDSLVRLTKRLNDPDWTAPGRTIEGKALVPFAWIDF